MKRKIESKIVGGTRERNFSTQKRFQISIIDVEKVRNTKKIFLNILLKYMYYVFSCLHMVLLFELCLPTEFIRSVLME